MTSKALRLATLCLIAPVLHVPDSCAQQVSLHVVGNMAGHSVGADLSINMLAGELVVGGVASAQHDALFGFWHAEHATSPDYGVGIESDPSLPDGIPDKVSLAPNYPNPAARETNLILGMPESGEARVAVFDMLGRKIRIVLDGPLAAGWHRIPIRTADLPSGTYFVRLSAQRDHDTRAITVTH